MFPILYQSDHFIVPTYFVIISLTCCLCIWWSARRADQFNLNRNLALDLTLVVLCFGFVGARAFHVIFEYPEVYLLNPIRILRFWEGGFVFYGGAVGGAISGILFLKLKKEATSTWLDFAAPILALGYSIGRIGCFFAGCCYGKFCTLPWAVTFSRGVEAPSGIPLHPTQIYAALFEVFILIFLLQIESKKTTSSTLSKLSTKKGDVFYMWMMLHGLGRIFMEVFRDDYRGPHTLSLSLSTYISLVVIGLGVFLYVFSGPKDLSKKQS